MMEIGLKNYTRDIVDDRSGQLTVIGNDEPHAFPANHFLAG
jgi:hypothetical protein